MKRQYFCIKSFVRHYVYNRFGHAWSSYNIPVFVHKTSQRKGQTNTGRYHQESNKFTYVSIHFSVSWTPTWRPCTISANSRLFMHLSTSWRIIVCTTYHVTHRFTCNQHFSRHIGECTFSEALRIITWNDLIIRKLKDGIESFCMHLFQNLFLYWRHWTLHFPSETNVHWSYLVQV